jgi:class 3 adenylate cyclase
MDRYDETVRRVLTSYGASIGKRHGDDFMAAFGVQEFHEDDALRAVRAASELREAIGEIAAELQRERGIDLKVRLGVNTGTVLVRDAETIGAELPGDTVNLAKRFEEAAGRDEILLGEETYRLVASSVRAEPAEALAVQGLPDLQETWRVLEVLPDRPGRLRQPALRASPDIDSPPVDLGFAAYERRLVEELRARLAERLAAMQAAGQDAYQLPEPQELAERMLAAIPLSHEWDAQVGPFYETAGLSRWLGITRQGVHDRARRRALLAVMTSDGKTLYPAWQFDDAGRVLPGLREVLEVFRDVPVNDWRVAVWLTTPDEALGHRTPAQWLRDGLATEMVQELAVDLAARWRW